MPSIHALRFDSLGCRTAYAQRLVEVRYQVVHVLDPDGQPQQSLVNDAVRTFDRSPVLHQALHDEAGDCVTDAGAGTAAAVSTPPQDTHWSIGATWRP